jgi:6-pyruvoyl-tetrahydropterin synthase
MNTRIFKLIHENLESAFSLPKYDSIRETLCENTRIDFLPWTPARFQKFEDRIKEELQFDSIDLKGTVEEVVDRLDKRYLNRFFGEIWKPTTEVYQYSGWALVDAINKEKPKAVLDFGCGYNPFKGRIENLVGIDPYNNCADYMVDILEFKVDPESFDHIIVFGSLNFNSKQDIETRFKRLVEILMPGGKMYFRANPGILWPNGPYVDIFPWSFEIAHEFSKTYNLHLETFKKDNNDRLYFEYKKL